MLKRANIALISAAAPGFLAFTGWLEELTPVAGFVALALLGFSGLSYLLFLFEDEDLPLPAQRAEIASEKAPQPLGWF